MLKNPTLILNKVNQNLNLEIFMNNTIQDFDGIFRFTNATTEDFTGLWNNKEYTFKAGTCSKIIIPEETSENVQEIRKKWAYKLAQREFYKSDDYNAMKEQGRGLPPTYTDSKLTEWIQQCLEPLPEGKADVIEKVVKPVQTKVAKSVGSKQNLNEMFKDDEPEEFGEM